VPVPNAGLCPSGVPKKSHPPRRVQHRIHNRRDGVDIGLEGDIEADEEVVGLEIAGFGHRLSFK